jgi:hypothetical protein
MIHRVTLKDPLYHTQQRNKIQFFDRFVFAFSFTSHVWLIYEHFAYSLESWISLILIKRVFSSKNWHSKRYDDVHQVHLWLSFIFLTVRRIQVFCCNVRGCVKRKGKNLIASRMTHNILLHITITK